MRSEPAPAPIPLHPNAAPPPPPIPEATSGAYSVDDVWTAKLGRPFTPIANAFLIHGHKLAPAGGQCLTPTETMVIIHLMSWKRGRKNPRVALGILATRMGVTVRTVRAAVQRLEGLGYLQRIPDPQGGGANTYRLDGLFQALEAILEREANRSEAEE